MSACPPTPVKRSLGHAHIHGVPTKKNSKVAVKAVKELIFFSFLEVKVERIEVEIFPYLWLTEQSFFKFVVLRRALEFDRT